MKHVDEMEQSIELLQQLGLKEYEAKSFVALSRLPQGTARDISEISDVPRTRVYDSIRVLESKGLVEIHHSNPKQFRTVSVEEAVDILESEYNSRIDELAESLAALEPAEDTETKEITHEVWALSGSSAIATRSQQLVSDADRELVMVIGQESVVTPEFLETVTAVQERGVTAVIGTIDEDLADQLRDALPDAKIFVSELDWLRSSPVQNDDVVITQLLLIDRDTILASTVHEDHAGREQAVFGQGLNNGLVTIVRRLMITGLLSGVEAREVLR